MVNLEIKFVLTFSKKYKFILNEINRTTEELLCDVLIETGGMETHRIDRIERFQNKIKKLSTY
jgi:hypothetical protein